MTSSSEWRGYFERNAHALHDLPWAVGGDLTPAERSLIASSVQDFQVGERSEGRYLHRYAQQYSQSTGDPDYLAAIRLFIGEEQRHARDLGRFLHLNHLPTVKTTWPDRVFRTLRRQFGGLEMSIAVLITAELIANVYYAALQQATQSRLLRALCAQILQDERNHVTFQAEQLGKLRCGRPPVLLGATMALQRLLYGGTCFVVWHNHRNVLRQAHRGFRAFWVQCWAEFNRAFALAPRTGSPVSGSELGGGPSHLARVEGSTSC